MGQTEDGGVSPELVSVKDAAKALGVGLSTFYEWKTKGWVRFEGRGKVNLEAARASLAAAGIEVGAGPGRSPKPEPRMSYAEAERRRMVALAENAEIEVGKKRARLVDRATAEQRTLDLAVKSRDSWRTWPLDVAPAIAAELGIGDVDVVRRVLEKHVHARLSGLRDIVVRLVS